MPDRPSEPPTARTSFLARFRTNLQAFILRRRAEEAIIEAVEEIMEEPASGPASMGEKELLTNILAVRARTVEHIKVPRVDIFAADENMDLRQLAKVMSASGHSRVPVFRNTLDDIIGFVHIKDVTAAIVGDKPVALKDIIHKPIFVPPSMPVTKLLLQMKQKRTHMALVVDEFGGMDGLVTIEDAVEEIVGEIDDEHDDPEASLRLQRRPDGSVIVDARTALDTFEEEIGPVFQEHEKQDVETLGGLVFALAGRVPSRGETLRHSSGMLLEVLDGDTRRVKRLRLLNLPKPEAVSAG